MYERGGRAEAKAFRVDHKLASAHLGRLNKEGDDNHVRCEHLRMQRPAQMVV